MIADTPSGEIDGTFVPRVADRVAWAEVDEEIVIYQEDTERVHVLGGTAAIVWGGIDGTTSLDRLIGELTEAFGADQSIVRSDVVELVGDLASKRLIAAVDPSADRLEDSGGTQASAGSRDRSPTFLREPPTG